MIEPSLLPECVSCHQRLDLAVDHPGLIKDLLKKDKNTFFPPNQVLHRCTCGLKYYVTVYFDGNITYKMELINESNSNTNQTS